MKKRRNEETTRRRNGETERRKHEETEKQRRNEKTETRRNAETETRRNEETDTRRNEEVKRHKKEATDQDRHRYGTTGFETHGDAVTPELRRRNTRDIENGKRNGNFHGPRVHGTTGGYQPPIPNLAIHLPVLKKNYKGPFNVKRCLGNHGDARVPDLRKREDEETNLEHEVNQKRKKNKKKKQATELGAGGQQPGDKMTSATDSKSGHAHACS